MKEKELTDEEIVKAILQRIEYNAGIAYINGKQIKTIRFAEILDLINRQKAEIERLTEENKHLDKLLGEKRLDELNVAKQIVAQNCILNEQNTELQKQVDELKNKCCEISFERYEEGKYDTAKEILQEGKYCLSKSLQDWIKERYGVEVE